MGSVRMKVGLRLKLGDRFFEVKKENPDHSLQLERLEEVSQTLAVGRKQIELVESGETIRLPGDRMKRELLNGNLEFLGDKVQMEYARSRGKLGSLEDMADLDESTRKEVNRRFEYVGRVQSLKPGSLTAKSLNPIIAEVADKTGDMNPPSWITLYRWDKNFKKREDVRDLIPAHALKGNRKTKVTPEVWEKIDGAIDELYLTEERLSVKDVHLKVVNLIDRDNVHRKGDDRLEYPHASTIHRAVKKLDPYEVIRARYGKKVADIRFSQSKEGVRPTRYLERVEMDDTKLDLLVVDDESRLILGRPWITSAIDVYTKCPVGVYVGFEPPSYDTAAKCLKHAILPKNNIREEFPGVVNLWNTYGVPECIYVDNAMGFKSNSLKEGCFQLKIVVQYAPKRAPNYKAAIERHFGTLNSDLLHKQPGTTFSNILDKDDYHPEKNAVIRFSTFKEMLYKWIVDIYMQSYHKGIKGLPAKALEKALQEFPPTLPTSKKALDIMLGKVIHRSVTRSGIELFGLIYNDDGLAAIRTLLCDGGKAKIKYDPTDLSIIHVMDPLEDRYIPVKCLAWDYAEGLSEYQHKIIRNFALKNGDKADISALAAAKAYIADLVEKELQRGRKIGAKGKATRYKKSGKKDSAKKGGSKTQSGKSGAGAGGLPANPKEGALSDIRPGISEIGKVVVPCADALEAQVATADDNGGCPNEVEVENAGTGWGVRYDLPMNRGGGNG